MIKKGVLLDKSGQRRPDLPQQNRIPNQATYAYFSSNIIGGI